MRFSTDPIWISLIIGGLAGLFGTLCMDRIGGILRKRRTITGVPAVQVAKWFAYLPRGRLRHKNIANSAEIPVSMSRMRLIHYGIGLVLGVAYAPLHMLSSRTAEAIDRFHRLDRSVASLDPVVLSALSRPTLPYTLPVELLFALAFGISTSVFAWFVLFPGMGYGAFGTRAPTRLRLMRTSLVNHAIFGLGVGAFWLSAFAVYHRG
jgi:hypothetical protein